jgi:hypothetical protein
MDPKYEALGKTRNASGTKGNKKLLSLFSFAVQAFFTK